MKSKQTLVILVAVMLASCSRQPAPPSTPLSVPEVGEQGVTSLQDCARAALRAAVALGGDHEEVGGALYSLGGKCYYTQPVTQQLADAVDYRIELPAGAKLIAVFHTHPGDPSLADQFSASDSALEARLGVPMYVAAVEDRVVLTLDSGRVMPDTRLSLRRADKSGDWT